jgi:hypothetical protein
MYRKRIFQRPRRFCAHALSHLTPPKILSPQDPPVVVHPPVQDAVGKYQEEVQNPGAKQEDGEENRKSVEEWQVGANFSNGRSVQCSAAVLRLLRERGDIALLGLCDLRCVSFLKALLMPSK